MLRVVHREKAAMSRRKHERRLEASYGIVLTPWIMGLLTVGILLTLALYVGTMPL
jgi:hypothetical protein